MRPLPSVTVCHGPSCQGELLLGAVPLTRGPQVAAVRPAGRRDRGRSLAWRPLAFKGGVGERESQRAVQDLLWGQRGRDVTPAVAGVNSETL